MLDQGTKTIDWDDFRFVLAIVRGGSVSAAAKQLAVDAELNSGGITEREARELPDQVRLLVRERHAGEHRDGVAPAQRRSRILASWNWRRRAAA